MAKAYSGFTAKTAENLLLGSGAFFVDYDVETDTFDTAVAAGKLLGASRGGGEFTATPEIRKIEIDGVHGSAKGLTVIDSWEVKMTANILEITKETLAKALTSSTVDSLTNEEYDIIRANNDIDIASYVDNITFVGTKSGSAEPLIIQIYNAINTSGLTLTTEDKNEAVIAMEFEGHYDSDDLDNPPFAIYVPKSVVPGP